MPQGDFVTIIWTLVGVAFALQLAMGIGVLLFVRSVRREQSKLHHELYGLVRKMEGLTANRREHFVKHYNKMLDALAIRLPTTVAAEAGNLIFETESKLLSRLAELEPHFQNNQESRKKMDDLIVSMERLEHTLVSATAEAVQRVMVEGRQFLIEEEGFDDSLAA